MRTRTSRLATLTVLLLVASALLAGCASTQTVGASTSDDSNNWPMYHRTYDAYRYSPLGRSTSRT
jgi:outer membrane biogenesis lipoprotein LolB